MLQLNICYIKYVCTRNNPKFHINSRKENIEIIISVTLKFHSVCALLKLAPKNMHFLEFKVVAYILFYHLQTLQDCTLDCWYMYMRIYVICV